MYYHRNVDKFCDSHAGNVIQITIFYNKFNNKLCRGLFLNCRVDRYNINRIIYVYDLKQIRR